MRSSLTIHVSFLRETVFVPTNNPNMEETDSLEKPTPPVNCDLDLNRARSCHMGWRMGYFLVVRRLSF